MSKGKTLIFGIFVCLVIAACQKDDSPQDDAAILVAGKWQMSAASAVIPGTSISINIYDSLPACVKDNFYTFASDGTATIDEGASKCDASDPQTLTGSWKLLNNNTQLQTIEPLTSTQETLTLLNISSSSFQVQDTASINYMGTPVTINATISFKNVK